MPGPTSRTLSVGRKFAYVFMSTPEPCRNPTRKLAHFIYDASKASGESNTPNSARTLGRFADFLRMCWPNRSVLNIGLLDEPPPVEACFSGLVFCCALDVVRERTVLM